jgi:hypothetical protein
MPRTKNNKSNRNLNEDSKSAVSQRSGSQAHSNRGKNSARKSSKARAPASDRSGSKSKNVKEEEYSASQPPIKVESLKVSVEASQPAQNKQATAVPLSVMEIQAAYRRGNVPGSAVQNAPQRLVDPRYAASQPSAPGSSQTRPGGSVGPGGAQTPRLAPNIPPQITAADVARAQSSMPSDSELVEAEIAGEKVKASVKTIDYLKRFEGFLNKNPNEKLQFLNEKFFRKVPRDNAIFKTNRGKEVKCPV